MNLHISDLGACLRGQTIRAADPVFFSYVVGGMYLGEHVSHHYPTVLVTKNLVYKSQALYIVADT